jgi:hypothetical protein
LTPIGATIDIDTVTGWQDHEEPLRVKCHLHASRFATVTHQRMLFPIAVLQVNRKNPFAQSYRTQPVYLQHGYREIDKITVSLPDGYRIEAMPPDSNEKAAFASFETKRISEAGVVRLERHAEVNGYYFPVGAYGSLREYFMKVRQHDAENVVLHEVGSAQVR